MINRKRIPMVKTPKPEVYPGAKWTQYLEHNCCAECHWVEPIREADSPARFPSRPRKYCPDCGGKIESVVGRLMYEEEKARFWLVIPSIIRRYICFYPRRYEQRIIDQAKK